MFSGLKFKGGGIDCFLSAKQVGPSGKVYGLDMTESMIALARQNAKEAGISNVEFLLGRMESIPLPDDSVDIVISNCVINLAIDKTLVLKEAFRVLKKGGKFAVSDIVLKKPLPSEIVSDVRMWSGCIGGGLVIKDYEDKLKNVGFDTVSIEETRVYNESDVLLTTMTGADRSI